MAYLQIQHTTTVVWASALGNETNRVYLPGDRIAGNITVTETCYQITRSNGDSATVPLAAATPVVTPVPAKPPSLCLTIFAANAVVNDDILQVKQVGNLFDVVKHKEGPPTKGLHINELLMLIRLTFGPLYPDHTAPTRCLSMAAAAAGVASKAISQAPGVASSRLVFRGDGGKIEFTLDTGESYEMPLVRVLRKSDGQTQSSPGDTPPRS